MVEREEGPGGVGAEDRLVGLDVGGANLKLAVAAAGRGPRAEEASAGGSAVRRLVTAESHPFALWRRPEDLPARLAALAAGHPAGRVALAMTGELADGYPDRRRGVEAILAAALGAWPGADLRVLCADGEWRSPAEVRARPEMAAAASWRGPAALLARMPGRVLLADMGSTTTDLVPIRDGRVGGGARTDVERLEAGELVYTGLLRTPVAAMLRELPAAGSRPALPLAAERFAIAADVRLWRGDIEPRAYRCETPDGGARTREAAGRRLARMACSDPGELGTRGIDRIAREAAEAQARRIRRALERQRERGRLPERACVTGAGAAVLAKILRGAGLEVGETPPELAGRFAAAATAAAAALTFPPDAPVPRTDGSGPPGRRT